MHEVKSKAGLSKGALYGQLVVQMEGLFSGERDGLANMANTAALIYQMLPDLNWAGFYILRGDELVLGPFQGKIACVRIGMGRGVCGTAAVRLETIVVRDVEAFPGHIACDAASKSEIVVPLVVKGRLLGVLDLDSPLIGRFDEEDALGLNAAAKVLLESSDLRPVIG
jgi:L-methionine (R)-S-oxide reductase